MKRLFIVHGYMSKPHNHWFRWLKVQAELLGLSVSIPAMPKPSRPNKQTWVEALRQHVGKIDNRTWFVGHSLGCSAILQFICEQPYKDNPGGIILVSGFTEPVELIPSLNNFTDQLIDTDRIIQNIPYRAVIASLDDYVVPVELTLHLSQKINAFFYGLPNSGHFLGRDGFRKLPLVARLLGENVTY